MRFFTEQPDASNPKTRHDAEMQTKALEEEANKFGDLVFLDIDRGMNFALKLVSAMRYLSAQYTFDFFLRLDDDYFLCLRRLLGELEIVKHSRKAALSTGITPALENNTQHVLAVESEGSRLEYGKQDQPTPLLIYAGHRYCQKEHTRIDEAYILLSGPLVDRVLSTPNLICSKHAGISTGRWFTYGNPVNPTNDVTWVNDDRLDHGGRFWEKSRHAEAPRPSYESVCSSHIGVHHTYADQMRLLWAHASDTGEVLPKQGVSEAGVVESILKMYAGDGKCLTGVTEKIFARDGAQSCDGFRADVRVHCGKERCPHNRV